MQTHLKRILARLNAISPLPPTPTIVDIGAAQGVFLIACAREGYPAVGIEPSDEAREAGARLAELEGVQTRLLAGFAEDIPVESASVDVVHANQVIEHVRDAEAAFNEACRILKPGGVFWFSATSSVSPHQHEIDGFPLFGWYPLRLKRRVMEWVRVNKPHLIGYSNTPAINWLSPWGARRMLREAGFSRVYDRWDLRLSSEGGPKYRSVLRMIRLNWATKLAADVLVAECSYAAVK